MRKILLFVVAAFVTIGLVGGLYTVLDKRGANNRTTSSSAKTKTPASTTMDSMMNELKDKTGDAFDAAFINAMIEHHTGAVAMAQYIDTEAKHPELQTMAQQIISAQTKEIKDMIAWANQWGYALNQTSQADVDAMVANLKGKTGDELDKQFMTDMIAHHEGAIQMVTYVNANAKHQEVKNLGEEILVAQTMEIGTMQDWARDWGYDLGASGPSMPGHQMPE